jgi:glutaconate CoA-transferase, subunit B
MAAGWNLFSVCVLSRLLRERSHVLIGTNAAPHMSAALLAQALSGGTPKVTVIGSGKHSFLTDDLAEAFHCAAQGRFDCFVIGGGQIDGEANINLVGVGKHPTLKVRWPGSHGTPLLYLMIPNAIIFREEHTRRVMVEKVDFISAPGTSKPEIFRPGGPAHMLTNLGLFSFNSARRRFKLESCHPGKTVQDILDNTSFTFELPEELPVTEDARREEAEEVLNGIAAEVAAIYPDYAAELKKQAAAFLA